MEEKVYTRYDNECIVYLSLEILKCLLLEEYFIYIDEYYKSVLKIYEDYKQHDNTNLSLLDSIHKYIDEHEQEILNTIKIAFDGAF